MSRRVRLVVLTSLFLLVIVIPALADRTWPGKKWQNVKPDKIDYSPSSIRRANDFFTELGATGGMVVVGGRVVEDWGDSDIRVNVHGIRGCLLSALIGIHVERGDIDVSSTLAALGIDDTSPALTDGEKSTTVQQLLESRSGVFHAAAGDTASDKEQRPATAEPCARVLLVCRKLEDNVLAAILEKKTGHPIFETFKKDIADPIEMTDYSIPANHRVTSPDSQFPSYDFYMSARDLARFGYLYLTRGHWRSEQVIPAQWINDSVQAYSMPGQELGFGYQWYTSTASHFSFKLNSLAFSARGAGGQYIVVVPSYDLVMALTNDTDRKNPPSINNRQFGTLLSLVLHSKDAKNEDY